MIEGGLTRFHSVQNALKKVPEGVLVAVQDAVRPLLSVELIENMFHRMESSDKIGLIPVYPCVDTLISLNQDMRPMGTSPKREETFTVQTPQIFRSSELKEAYNKPYDSQFTDDASVLRSVYGEDCLSYCFGERYNLKITTREDLGIAEKLL